jgi:hypothetical protein
MRVVVLNDRPGNHKLRATDVKAGQSGLFGGMYVVTKGGRTLHRLVRIRPGPDSDEGLTTDFDNVSIGLDYPFQAARSTNIEGGFLQLKRGDTGYIEAAIEPHNDVALVVMPEKKVSGWVALKSINIGTEREYGNWAFQHVSPALNVNAVQLHHTANTETSLLAKTMKALLDTFSVNEASLGQFLDVCRPLLQKNVNRSWVVGLAIDGFKKANTYETLKNGKHTIQQLIKIAPTQGNRMPLESISDSTSTTSASSTLARR